MQPKQEVSYVVASDVNQRDGIGLETYIDGSLVLEIFRDDTERRTYVTLFNRIVDLAVVEASVARFRQDINPDYIEYDNVSEQA